MATTTYDQSGNRTTTQTSKRALYWGIAAAVLIIAAIAWTLSRRNADTIDQSATGTAPSAISTDRSTTTDTTTTTTDTAPGTAPSMDRAAGVGTGTNAVGADRAAGVTPTGEANGSSLGTGSDITPAEIAPQGTSGSSTP